MHSLSSKELFDYVYRGWRFPTLGLALAANQRALGHDKGLKNEDELLSSLNPPLEGFGDEYLYPRLFDVVAAIAYRVAKNHAFHDGNKRTALLITDTVLEWNRHKMTLSQDGRIVVFSLVGAGHLAQDGLRHALILACGLDPLGELP